MFSTLFENSGVGIMLVDENGKVAGPILKPAKCLDLKGRSLLD